MAIPSEAFINKGTCRDLTVGVLASNVEDNEKVQTTNCKGSENCSGTVITGSVVRSHESEPIFMLQNSRKLYK